jgi:hypothetical protein
MAGANLMPCPRSTRAASRTISSAHHRTSDRASGRAASDGWRADPTRRLWWRNMPSPSTSDIATIRRGAPTSTR